MKFLCWVVVGRMGFVDIDLNKKLEFIFEMVLKVLDFEFYVFFVKWDIEGNIVFYYVFEFGIVIVV